MEQPQRYARMTSAVRSIARAWSIVSVALVLGFLIGEGVNPSSAIEWLGFLFFPFGICVGMILAWWKECLGAITTVASLSIFYAIHCLSSGAFPSGWAWLAFAFPGFLFALRCWQSRKIESPAA